MMKQNIQKIILHRMIYPFWTGKILDLENFQFHNIQNVEINTALALDKSIQEGKLYLLFKNMKTINLLGVMGLQLKFVNELKVLIMKAIKHILLPRQLSISKREQYYISCWPKGERFRRVLNNWRPISLFNDFIRMYQLENKNHT